jgi:hypothetical protein
MSEAKSGSNPRGEIPGYRFAHPGYDGTQWHLLHLAAAIAKSGPGLAIVALARQDVPCAPKPKSWSKTSSSRSNC